MWSLPTWEHRGPSENMCRSYSAALGYREKSGLRDFISAKNCNHNHDTHKHTNMPLIIPNSKKENGPYQHDLRTISFKVVLWRKSFKHNWQRYCSSRRQKWPIHGWGHKNFLWRLLTCPLSQEFINQYVGLFKSAKTLSESCEHFANVIYRQKAGADKEHQMQKRKVRQDSQPPNLSQLSKSRKENALQNWRDVGYNWIPSVLVRRHCKKAIKFWRKVT